MNDQAIKQKFNRETDYFLDILDPYQCDKIPLSDIIKLFSSHKVDIGAADRVIDPAVNFISGDGFA